MKTKSTIFHRKLMMKTASLIVLSIIICACSTNNKSLPSGIEIIPVEVDEVSQDVSLFLEKIEIVPLETNDSSLFHRCNKVLYDKRTDMFVIYTSDQIIYTFSGNGQYVANSKKMKGQGPEDYVMVLDINLNPYLKGIDLLNPYGTIYTYSPTFELLAKRKFKPEFPVDYLMALDTDNYIFTNPFMWTDQEVSFVNLRTQEAISANYEGTISENTMAHNCFYHIGEQFYFVPFGLNYYFYQINAKEKKLNPIMYLDFGDAEVEDDNLPGRASGKRQYTEVAQKGLERMMELYPEIYSCIGCNACTKACTQNLNVMQYIAYAQRGDFKKCAEESFDCIGCGICASRCPAGISHPMVGELARRLNGKYIAPKSEHVKNRVAEIKEGKFDDLIEQVMQKPIEEMQELYNNREIEK